MPRATLQPSAGDLEDEVARLIALKGGSPDADLIHRVIEVALGLIDDHAPRGELKILASAVEEMRASFRVFAPYRTVRKVCVFGSARTPPERAEYQLARAVGSRFAALGFMVITGAGGGIMRAATEGAGRGPSFGLHIRLPFEALDESLYEGERLIQYKYFFTRKLTFVKETDGLVLFPGGFGTLDELFEALTLIQTGKSEMLPVVFLDVPGGDYWRSLVRHIDEQLVPRGLISPEDRGLFLVTEDIDEAVAEVATFYRNYHSLRYVRDLTVIRHGVPIDDAVLAALNAEFGDLLLGGRIERSGPLPDEANEPDLAALPRLVLAFNRRSYAGLRRLIDRLNRAAPDLPAPAPAVPAVAGSPAGPARG